MFRYCLILFLLLLAVPARAQTPPSVEPDQIIRRFDPPAAPRATERAETPPQVPMPDQTGSTRFVLKDVVIEGMTVYTREDLNPLITEFTGKDVAFADLRALARKLTAKYRKDGYLISRVAVPPQKIRNGVVRLQALEGFVSKVFFEGDSGGEERFFRNAAEKILAARPLTAQRLERSLLLMDDLPGVTVKSVFRPSPDVPHASELVIQIFRNKMEGAVSADNRGSRFLGPLQFGAVAGLNGVVREFDRVTLRGITTASLNEMNFADAVYEQPLGYNGTTLSLRGAYTKTEPGGTLDPLNIKGDSILAELRLSHPFVRQRRKNVTGYASAHYLDTETDLSGIPSGKDHVRSARLGITADAADPLGGVTLVDLQVRQGMDILNTTRNGAGRSRTNGDHRFTSVNAYITRAQSLPGKFSVLLSGAGQYAADALLASEEFAVGGGTFGRGYDAAEITGDHGAAGSVELRYADATSSPLVESYQFYAFYDLGAVWNRSRVALEDARDSLASAGAGIHMNFIRETTGTVELAIPLTRPVQAENRNGNHARLFFRVNKRF